jgi:hypothetical protein
MASQLLRKPRLRQQKDVEEGLAVAFHTPSVQPVILPMTLGHPA